MIDQRFKFGAILAFTLIQLSNGLDGGLVVPQSRKRIKKQTAQVIVGYPTSLGYRSYGSNSSAVNIDCFGAIVNFNTVRTVIVQ